MSQENSEVEELANLIRDIHKSELCDLNLSPIYLAKQLINAGYSRAKPSVDQEKEWFKNGWLQCLQTQQDINYKPSVCEHDPEIHPLTKTKWCKKCHICLEDNISKPLEPSTKSKILKILHKRVNRPTQYGDKWFPLTDEETANEIVKVISSSPAREVPSVLEISDTIKNDVVGKSALDNWGVKGEDNFMQIGEIAHNRFYRLGEKIRNLILGRRDND